MNKLTKYACILTTLAGAWLVREVKKHKETMPLSLFLKSGDTGQRPVPVETVYPDLLSGR